MGIERRKTCIRRADGFVSSNGRGQAHWLKPVLAPSGYKDSSRNGNVNGLGNGHEKKKKKKKKKLLTQLVPTSEIVLSDIKI